MKTLFNRNRIILTEESISSNEAYVILESGYLSKTLGDSDGRFEKKVKYKKVKVTRKLESPLGFYYYKEEWVTEETEEETKNPHVSLCEIKLVGKKHKYFLSYPISQNGIKVSTETRPWNIVGGYKSLPDHFIQDLYNDLEAIFSELNGDKAVVKKGTGEWNWVTKSYTLIKSDESLGQFKKNLYLQLFGNTKGPREQTNSEKILAHGFDLKESFRKPKETK